jgi:hypothetical protein
MHRTLVLAVLLVTAASQAQPNAKPGDVLSEKSTEIAHGYRQIARSQVNPPGHWEGVGHFVFVYFNDKRLCQCSADEIAIAPNGRYAVFVDETSGWLMLFDATTSKQQPLTDHYVGTPYASEWDLAGKRAVVQVRKWIKEKNDYERHPVSLNLNGT